MIVVKIGSIWREHDSRFERFVQVISLGSTGGEDWAEIAMCRPDGSWRANRTTKARVRRFGKAYKLTKSAALANENDKDINGAL